MNRASFFRSIFTIAALLFIAKPFFGYSACDLRSPMQETHTILAKSFTKRKPEDLEEAESNSERIHQALINPVLLLSSAIAFLLLSLVASVFKNIQTITNRLIAEINLALLPPQPAYLLTGKLII